MSAGEDTVPILGLAGAGRAAIGSRVGRYVVLEEVGRGGMGRVLRAYDPRLQREVALKEVRSETLGPAGAQRLVAEARAMAKLSHPNVVAVYDVEELEGGEVVLVMEYVRGQTLTAWLQQPRIWRDTLACFRRAGRGLAAAHAAGLLHRDFKPDNVLVGSDGRVRVTDFGLAREIVGEHTDEHAEADGPAPPRVVEIGRTATGTIVGTLPYLSPERLLGAAADAATDQFAYCVSLWEALFGARPFAGKSVAELAFAMSAGRPQPPAGPARPPAWLLETITRGLANDPSARWPSMAALLAALDHDPALRRRRWLQAAATVGVVGVGAIGVQSWVAARAQRCTEEAAAAHLQGSWDDQRRAEASAAVLGIGAAYAGDVWTRTEQRLDAYASGWTQMHVETCEATTVRGEQSAAVMDLRMACLQRANTELAAVTEVLAAADPQTVQKAHELVASLRPLERCADVAALQADVEPALPEELEAVQRVRTEIAAAKAARLAGHYDQARARIDTAKAIAEPLRYAPVRAELTVENGIVYAHAGAYAEAEAALRDGLQQASAGHLWGTMQDAATVLVSVVGYWQRRFDVAVGYGDLARGLAAGDPVREARVCNNLALGLLAQGKFAEAEAEQRRALALRESTLAPDDPDLATTRANLANILDAQGRSAEAEVEHRRALAQLERAIGPSHPRVAMSHNNLSIVLSGQGKHAEGEAEARLALAMKLAALGPDHPDIATSRDALANALLGQKKYAEAEAEHRQALALTERVIGPEHPRVAASLSNLALVVAAQERYAEAEAIHRRALAMREKLMRPAHPEIAQSHNNLAVALARQQRFGEAAAEYRSALAVWEQELPPDHPRVMQCRVDLESAERDAAGTLAVAAEPTSKPQ